MVAVATAIAAVPAMFGSTLASPVWLALFLIFTGPRLVAGAGGIMDDERLLHSDGHWHRMQRKRVTFESACYYSHEAELPYGCQYAASQDQGSPLRPYGEVSRWRNDPRRVTERDVLESFYTDLGGNNWRTVDNWNKGDPCWDAWYGVTCDEHGHVISIELVDNKLYGTITGTIGELSSLLKLDVSTTAPQFHNHANKNVNRIHGVVPSLAKISRIEELTISGNSITALPDDLYRNGHSLRMVSASYNLLSAMPKYMNRYTRLHTLELDHNRIGGILPPDLGMMPEARYIHLDTNQLAGDMPSTISNLKRIRTFDVSHNPGLTSFITEDVIVNWAEAEYLAILNTSISGYISSLCLDVPFCWKYMFDTHKDLTWATAADVPDIVNMTIELARSHPLGPATVGIGS